MGKRARRRIGRPASRTPTTLVFVGASLEDALGSRLKKAFAEARCFPDLGGPEINGADLALGIFKASDNHRPQAFAAWAHAAGVPALCVELGENEALIGPLGLPGRAGCGRCASERMAAAFAAGLHPERVRASRDVAGVAGPALVREVRAIIRRGPESSQLLDHILVVDAKTLDESLHRVVPLPRCTVCGGAAAFPQTSRETVRLSPEDSPDVVLDALAGWVDGRTGVISGVFLEPPGDMAVGLPFIATAAPPHVMDEDGSLRRLPLGWGKGLTVSGAVLSAVGEAIERYAASLPDSERIIWER